MVLNFEKKKFIGKRVAKRDVTMLCGSDTSDTDKDIQSLIIFNSVERYFEEFYMNWDGIVHCSCKHKYFAIPWSLVRVKVSIYGISKVLVINCKSFLIRLNKKFPTN